MELTAQEIVRLVTGLVDFTIAPDQVDWDEMTGEQQREVAALVRYEIQCRIDASRLVHQRRAYRLLRMLLSPEEQHELTVSKCITVIGSLGGRYRLRPITGVAWELQRHGRRWYEVCLHCIHDQMDQLPPADLTIAHLLMLRTDEGAFLAQANHHPKKIACWDGAYLRARAAIRKQRRSAA